MSLLMGGKAMASAIMLMFEAIRQRRNVLDRLKRSQCSKEMREKVLAQEGALHALEIALCSYGRGTSLDIANALEALDEADLALAGEGFGTFFFVGELVRYEPRLIWDERLGRYAGLGFYNPATGHYDLSRDAGWTLAGLPRRKKSA